MPPIFKFVAFALCILVLPACTAEEPAVDRAPADADIEAVGGIDHYVYGLPDEASADALASEATQREGWTVLEKSEYEPGDWTLILHQDVSVDSREVEQTADELDALASEHGALYDGWGASVE